MALSLRAVLPALCLFFTCLSANLAEGPVANRRAMAEPRRVQESAAASPRGTGFVAIERVVQIARETAPAIAAARARVAQAEGQRLTTLLPPDPELTAGLGQGEPRDGGRGAGESSLELSQFFPAPWALRARSRAGSALIAAARDAVDSVTTEVVLEARLLFYQAAVGQAQAVALAEEAGHATELRDLMARRVDVGEAPEADRLRTRVEALRAELGARDAAAQAAGARSALNRFLLGALGPDYSVSPDLDPRRMPAAPVNLVEVSLSWNPAYRAALSRVEAAKRTLTAERASRLPGLGLSVFREKEFDRLGTGATLGMTIPIWNRNQAAIAVSGAELAEAEAEALSLRSRIEAEVERLMTIDRTAREVAIAYHEEVLPIALESLSIARFSVEQGESSLLSWLEARRSYLEILKASYEAQLQAFQSRAELERLAGEFHASNQN